MAINRLAALEELGRRFGTRLSLAAAVREQHGHDEGHHPTQAPDAVLFATSTGDVAEAVMICARHRLPVIAFGTGTALEGGVTAPQGGLAIDLTGLNRVVRLSVEDLDVTVEAGVTRKQLNEYLRDTGLFFPIDPGADASLGGMAATRASGTNAVRYGTMREAVLGLKVVLADGRIITTGGRARKSAAGYDLTRLMVGSEGTLGIITEVTLRLRGIPEAVSAAVCPFATLAGAVDAVIATIQQEIPVARIEVLDEVAVDSVNRYSKLTLPVQPTLFLEFHGTPAAVEEQSERVAAIFNEFGGQGFQWASMAEDRSRLWRARHEAYWAGVALRPGARGWPSDVCVPISRLAECILETKQDLASCPVPAPLVGHVGDGNFHLVFVVDPDSAAEAEEVRKLNDRLVRRALAMGGTCTGEHGIGCGKREYLELEHGEGVMVMRQIKAALDPYGILNPEKVVSAHLGSGP